MLWKSVGKHYSRRGFNNSKLKRYFNFLVCKKSQANAQKQTRSSHYKSGVFGEFVKAEKACGTNVIGRFRYE